MAETIIITDFSPEAIKIVILGSSNPATPKDGTYYLDKDSLSVSVLGPSTAQYVNITDVRRSLDIPWASVIAPVTASPLLLAAAIEAMRLTGGSSVIVTNPVTIAGTPRTQTIIRAIAPGAIAIGKIGISFLNAGATDALIDGVVLKAGEEIEWGTNGFDTLAAMTYDPQLSELLIATLQ